MFSDARVQFKNECLQALNGLPQGLVQIVEKVLLGDEEKEELEIGEIQMSERVQKMIDLKEQQKLKGEGPEQEIADSESEAEKAESKISLSEDSVKSRPQKPEAEQEIFQRQQNPGSVLKKLEFIRVAYQKEIQREESQKLASGKKTYRQLEQEMEEFDLML